MLRKVVSTLVLSAISIAYVKAQTSDPVLQLLKNAQHHAEQHGAKYKVILSPLDNLLQGADPKVNMSAVQKAGFPVIVWTVNDAKRIRALLEQHADGIISDRPDLLLQAMNDSKDQNYIAHFDNEGHRGGRDLRPENTLPAFEEGLNNLLSTLETDTGVTSDHVSLISHERFINPQTCRRADGASYSEQNRVWIKDISMAEAQKQFICDKTFRGPQQRNYLTLSPVAVAFAKAQGLPSPYSPVNAEQLFDFVAFYLNYYKDGSGAKLPEAKARWQNAEKVRFNLETKIDPRYPDQTLSPEDFVNALCGAVTKHHLESRSDVQSFDFRTLVLTQERYPAIQTVYLLGDMQAVQPALLPEALR
jgi:glycerophosphoryl diester phosphodiesterase